MSRLAYIPQMVRIDSTGTPYPNAKANFYLTGTTTRTDTYEDNALSTPHDNPVIADAEGQFPVIYLEAAITYRMVLTDENDVGIDDIDPFSTPITGGTVIVTDSGGYFAGSTAEAIFADLGENFVKASRNHTMTNTLTWSSGSIILSDLALTRALLTDFAVAHATASSSSGTLTLDYTAAQSYAVTLTENITTFNVTGWPASGNEGILTVRFTQDGGGGAYTVALPSGAVTPASAGWTMTATDDAV